MDLTLDDNNLKMLEYLWFLLVGVLIGGCAIGFTLAVLHKELWQWCCRRAVRILRRRNRKIADLTLANRKLAKENNKLKKNLPI
jgi:hypothetical protein